MNTTTTADLKVSCPKCGSDRIADQELVYNLTDIYAWRLVTQPDGTEAPTVEEYEDDNEIVWDATETPRRFSDGEPAPYFCRGCYAELTAAELVVSHTDGGD